MQPVYPPHSAGYEPGTERRGVSRPVNGDTRRCPSCLTGWVEFNDRWRGGSVPTTPAWVCDRCQSQVLVRSEPLQIVDKLERLARTLSEQGLHGALRLLNSTTEYRFTGLYRFEGNWVQSIALFDRKNPALFVGAHVPWQDSYCRMTAEDGQVCRIDNALMDSRLTTHAARDAVQSYIAVLLRSAEGASLGTICHFDVCPRPADDRAIDELKSVRSCLERALLA